METSGFPDCSSKGDWLSKVDLLQGFGATGPLQRLLATQCPVRIARVPPRDASNLPEASGYNCSRLLYHQLIIVTPRFRFQFLDDVSVLRSDKHIGFHSFIPWFF
jgi:hypothetical protein